MATTRNNYVFKGHKTLLGNKYVTYGELELPLRYDIFSKSKNGFDWGHNGSEPTQLAFSMLYQVGNEEFAKENASKYASEIIQTLNKRDWILNASDVLGWIDSNTEQKEIIEPEIKAKVTSKKTKKQKTNVIKAVCKELKITQKNLAEILEVPEGTVSSWAVKNEIPRLGKKAIEFYILNKKNQDIVESYKNFVTLLHASH